MRSNDNRLCDLMNYERQGSNSNNYGTSQTSSSPESFPGIMENGVMIECKSLHFSSEISEVDNKDETKNPV